MVRLFFLVPLLFNSIAIIVVIVAIVVIRRLRG